MQFILQFTISERSASKTQIMDWYLTFFVCPSILDLNFFQLCFISYIPVHELHNHEYTVLR